jgi:hypothetical protein
MELLAIRRIRAVFLAKHHAKAAAMPILVIRACTATFFTEAWMPTNV